MKLEDIKVGGKYVPKAKTAPGFEGLDLCNHWRDAKKSNKPYLYCVGFDKVTTDWCPPITQVDVVVVNMDPSMDGGNLYMPEDLEPYVENETKNENMSKKEFTVDIDFIKKAHAAACGDWKVILESKFPDAFKPQPFEFKKETTLTTSTLPNDLPFLVGRSWAPAGKEMKCLVLHSRYDVIVTEHEGRKVLEFIEKR